MGTLASGNYIIKEKVDGFLENKLSSIVSIGAGVISNLPTISMINGDIAPIAGNVIEDDALDILDYNALISCYGSKQITATCTMPPTSLSSGADINDDGNVNGSDYNLFLRELPTQH